MHILEICLPLAIVAETKDSVLKHLVWCITPSVQYTTAVIFQSLWLPPVDSGCQGSPEEELVARILLVLGWVSNTKHLHKGSTYKIFFQPQTMMWNQDNFCSSLGTSICNLNTCMCIFFQGCPNACSLTISSAHTSVIPSVHLPPAHPQ